MKSFHANGKLLISGEYVVLDGALALAIPTKKGQSLHFEAKDISILHWKSTDANGKIWFEAKYNSNNLNIIETSDIIKGEKLKEILLKAIELNGQTAKLNGVVNTLLEFPTDWGLGSSSTLISCIAKWFNIDPFKLHFEVSNGSGYDIACAQKKSSITYQLVNSNHIIKDVNWNPTFHESLFFVHLNKKQSSNNEVIRFFNKTKNINTALLTNKISKITKSIIESTDIDDFIIHIEKHEKIMSQVLNLPTIKKNKFSDYKGGIKSLGAWGGDFILATGGDKERAYFKNKGHFIQIEFKDMVK